VEFSGLGRRIPLLFEEKSFEAVCFIHLCLKQAQHHIPLPVHKTGVRQDMVLG